MCITVNIKNLRQNYDNFKKMHKKLDEKNITYKFTFLEINDEYVHILYVFPYEQHIDDVFDYMHE